MKKILKISLCVFFFCATAILSTFSLLNSKWGQAKLIQLASQQGIILSYKTLRFSFPLHVHAQNLQLQNAQLGSIKLESVDVSLEPLSLLRKNVVLHCHSIPYLKLNNELDELDIHFTSSQITLTRSFNHQIHAKVALCGDMEGTFSSSSIYHKLGTRFSCDLDLKNLGNDLKVNGEIKFSEGGYNFFTGVLQNIQGTIRAKDTTIELVNCTACDDETGKLSASGTLTIGPNQKYTLKGIANLDNLKVIKFAEFEILYSDSIALNCSENNFAVQSNLKNFVKWKEALSPNSQSIKLPDELSQIPLGDKTGMICEVKTIPIRNVLAPYNSSIIENGNGYLLFFRYDVVGDKISIPSNHSSLFDSYLGYIFLDKEFNQTTKEYEVVDLLNATVQDPRIFTFQSNYFLSYNEFSGPANAEKRRMKLAKIDLPANRVDYITDLEYGSSIVEKNWVPFTSKNNLGQENIHFIHDLTKNTLLKLETPQTNHFAEIAAPNPTFPWAKQWGTPRGGSTARLVDGEYLAFFHSSFFDKELKKWYVMGAYTFEANAPFRVTSISKNPILFSGIYDTPHHNTALLNLRCIFPGSFAIDKTGSTELIHLSCGENDCATKVITFDKNKLLQSMERIDFAKPTL